MTAWALVQVVAVPDADRGVCDFCKSDDFPVLAELKHPKEGNARACYHCTWCLSPKYGPKVASFIDSMGAGPAVAP